MQAVIDTVERLRDALAAADFTEVQTLLPTYIDNLVTLLSTSNPVAQSQAAIEEFHNLLSLARVMRAHISSQLSAVTREVSYNSVHAVAQRHSWRFEG